MAPPRLAGLRRRSPATVPTPDLTRRNWQKPSERELEGMDTDVVLDLAWGRLVFGQTFAEMRHILDALRAEGTGQRDICIYAR